MAWTRGWGPWPGPGAGAMARLDCIPENQEFPSAKNGLGRNLENLKGTVFWALCVQNYEDVFSAIPKSLKTGFKGFKRHIY